MKKRKKTIPHIEQVVERFLSHAEKRVLVLKGPWGTGKTYFWDKFFARRMKEHLSRSRCNSYSYVSLFGKTGAREIRSALIAGRISAEQDKGSKLRTVVWKWLTTIARRAREIEFPGIPRVSFPESLAEAIESQMIKNWLICFDDLERASKGFDMTEFCGLVSQLKERSCCKIVIIYNEGELNEADAGIFSKYREKCVDEEITFSPSYLRNIRIGFSDERMHGEAVEVFKELGVNNIRVFQRCAWVLEYFNKIVGALPGGTRSRFIRHVMILAACHYEKRLEVSLDGVHMHTREQQFLAHYQRDTEALGRRSRLLDSVGFDYHPLDHFVISVLQNGVCDEGLLEKAVKKVLKDDVLNSASAQRDSVWKLYNGNFRTTKVELQTEFKALLDEEGSNLSLQDLTTIWAFWRPWGAEDTLVSLSWELIQQKVQSLTSGECDELLQREPVPEVHAILLDRRRDLNSAKDLYEVVQQVASGGWSAAAAAYLDCVTQTDFEDLLLGAEDSDFLVVIRSFTRVLMGGAFESIKSEFLPALSKVRSRSPLDQKRVDLVIFGGNPPEELSNIDA